jgi:hypothetical protein
MVAQTMVGASAGFILDIAGYRSRFVLFRKKRYIK